MTLQEFISEANLLKALGLRPSQLERLRLEKGLRWIQLGAARFYRVESVCEFMVKMERQAVRFQRGNQGPIRGVVLEYDEGDARPLFEVAGG